MTQLIASLIVSSEKKNAAQSPEAKRLASLLSDDFSDVNDRAGGLVREIVRRTLARLDPGNRSKLQDVIDVALARVDVKASLRYWLRQKDGSAITLTALNCFQIDYFKYAHQEVLIPILFSPMTSGKTTLIRGLICFEIGQNQDTMKQLICQSDAAARQRGLKIMDTLESPHYKKVFPHIKKDMRQWGNEKLLVQRTRAAAGEVTRETKGNAGGVDATLSCLGITSRMITGTRTDLSDLDDVVTVESGSQNPKEGMTIDEALNTKVFTRDQAPIGQTSVVYDRRDNETRFRIIGTPYAQDDPVYKMRDWPGAATVLIGVNETFTAYNIQIWNLPLRYCQLLKRKYGTGPAGSFPACPDHVENALTERDQNTGLCSICSERRTIRWVFPPLDQENTKYCQEQGIEIALEHELGDGVATDLMNPPSFTMEIPLAIHRGWYLDKLRLANGDEGKFNLPYRCQVFAESEMAFPNFKNSVLEYYRDQPKEGIDDQVEMRVELLPVFTVQQGEDLNLVIGRPEATGHKGGNVKQSGWVSRLVDPPGESRIKIAWIDLSGMNRAGTVCTVATLTPQNRRRIVEISKGAWSGAEITELIDYVFSYHTDLQICYIESVGTQKLFVDEALKHKDKYPWWPKVRYFDKTTTKKADAQIGILTMGTSFSNGSFEIPNTLRMAGHGRKCPCGYCVGIMDGMNQTRQAEVKSDVLITFWGIHLQMPGSFKPPQTTAPTVQQRAVSGYDLMNAQPSSAMAQAIMGEIMPGAMSQRPAARSQSAVNQTQEEKTDGAEDNNQERRDTAVTILPSKKRSFEDEWGLPRR